MSPYRISARSESTPIRWATPWKRFYVKHFVTRKLFRCYCCGIHLSLKPNFDQIRDHHTNPSIHKECQSSSLQYPDAIIHEYIVSEGPGEYEADKARAKVASTLLERIIDNE